MAPVKMLKSFVVIALLMGVPEGEVRADLGRSDIPVLKEAYEVMAEKNPSLYGDPAAIECLAAMQVYHDALEDLLSGNNVDQEIVVEHLLTLQECLNSRGN